MANETLEQLYSIAQKAGDNPQWLDGNSFSSEIILNYETKITIHVMQDGENLIYQTPFVDLSQYTSSERVNLLLRLMELNGISKVVTSLSDELVYLRVWQPVTYDEKLDRQLFIQNYNAIARFYEENHDDFIPLKG